METILEDQRKLHEERERLIDLQAKELLRKKATVFTRSRVEFRVSCYFRDPLCFYFAVCCFVASRASELGSFSEASLGRECIFSLISILCTNTFYDDIFVAEIH